ncbi:MAG: hypothetical protein ABEL51_13985 [Salinibacter sp.]
MLFLALGAAVTVHAQDQEESSQEEPCQENSCQETAASNGGAGFFSIGVQFADLAALNNRLSSKGYPTFSSEMVSIGGGGYTVLNRFLIGGQGHGLITGEQGYNGRDVSVGGGYGLFTLGYLFRPTSNLHVYPQVGLGGGGVRLEIGSRGDAENFDDVLNDPNRSASVGRASLLVSLGGGLEYQFGGPEEHGGLRLGLRAGYLVSALNSDWQINTTTLSGGPDATLQGPFIRLTIGGSGTGHEDDEEDE